MFYLLVETGFLEVFSEREKPSLPSFTGFGVRNLLIDSTLSEL